MAKGKKAADNFAKDHVLVPVHSKLSSKEKTELFEKHSITVNNLPRIRPDDPAIADLNVKPGDVIKIERKSATMGSSVFYRGVSQ